MRSPKRRGSFCQFIFRFEPILMRTPKQGRHLLAGGMFLLSLLLYIDRICISVAKDPIAEELGLTDRTMGWVLSAFALGYALFQIPSGMMADRWGPRRILSSLVGIWSVLTVLSGIAWNYLSLLFIRFLFGAGEAGAFPGMSRAVFSWFPLKERGTILGINFSGSRLGAAFALPAVAWLIEWAGWRASFFVLGAVGIAWAIGWWLSFRDKPEEHPWLQAGEKDYILANRQELAHTPNADRLPLRAFLRLRSAWLLIGQYFASNFTFFFALTWLYPHLKKTFQLNPVETGIYALAPFLAGALGNWVAGLAVDKLYEKGMGNASRVIPAVIGFALAAIGMAGNAFANDALTAVVLLSVAIFGADMTLPPSWAFCVDIGKKDSGTVSGAMNMAGNLGSFVTALAFPYLALWLGSEHFFFYTAAGLNLFALGMWLSIKGSHV